MASEDKQKKWGTIFMGDREASVEQLNAMQEPLRKEKLQKEQTEDYMERVRARAADRAREILGAAYAERQKVLEEARADIQAQKRTAAEECAKIKAEGEILRKNAQKELEAAAAQREEAEKIRGAAHDEGYKAGMDEAGAEVYKYRAELGQSVAAVLRALERERKNILNYWREDLSTLAQCAAQAGTAYVLDKEYQAILRSLVFQALDMLENHTTVTLKVNPADEDKIGDMFSSVRDRFPDLRQWIVTGDEQIEPGGLVAESGSGSVDLKRENFRDMVDNIICHLGLPEQENEFQNPNEVRDIVEREVAHITSLTPELDLPPLPADPEPEPAPEAELPVEEAESGQPEADIAEGIPQDQASEEETQDPEGGEVPTPELPGEQTEMAPEEEDFTPDPAAAPVQDASLEELEEELFPLEEEAPAKAAPVPPKGEAPDPKALAEGGFI